MSEGPSGPANLGREQLIDAYRRMRAIREVDERLRREVEAGKVPGFLHLYSGQEAIAVGACVHLETTDHIASGHRPHGHFIAKGCDLGKLLLEIYCKRDGLCRGKGGTMHLVDLSKGVLGANGIVGAGPPIAVGAALSAATLGNGGVAMAFIGDGASSQGAVLESMHLAVMLKLPMIFVFENNGWSEFTGAEYHLAGVDIARRAGAFNMPSVKVDGLDFFAVSDAVAEAVRRARAGDGPSAVEATCARWVGHFEGDMQRYRAQGEVERLRAEADPIARFRARVVRDGVLEAAVLDRIDGELAALVDEKVAAAKAAPRPAREALFEDVYVSY
jgi:pyruvate dehydrogenase E1 component alpha subunit